MADGAPSVEATVGSGQTVASYACASVGGCYCPELAPTQNSHACNECSRPTHNLCNQKLRGSDDKADNGIKCGAIVCARDYSREQENELVRKLAQLRGEQAKSSSEERALQPTCCKQANCIDSSGAGINARCNHGQPCHFICFRQPCGNDCSQGKCIPVTRSGLGCVAVVDLVQMFTDVCISSEGTNDVLKPDIQNGSAWSYPHQQITSTGQLKRGARECPPLA